MQQCAAALKITGQQDAPAAHPDYSGVINAHLELAAAYQKLQEGK